jgi:glycosyltransferase involved in cell wall biosynthesis
MIRVLGLAMYGPLAASTRYRLGQYVEGLQQHGIALEVRHLLDDDYVSRRFSGRRVRLTGLLRAAARRVQDLRQQRRFDVSMLYCELMPLMPAVMESALLQLPYVYDFDDAFHLRYREGRMAILRRLLGRKIDDILRDAAQVTAGNRLLATYASDRNPRTHYLPTVVDTARYQPMHHARGTGRFTIGWIGSPSTAAYLSQLVEPLSVLGSEGPVRFVVIGGKAPVVPHVEVVELPWSERQEVQQINGFDVGVMPLPDSDWARGKCAFKLIQYMACALPVVASPVGANRDVVSADCGLLAGNGAEWVEALRTLRDRPSLRRQMGDAGRQRVESSYSLDANLPRLAQVLRQAAGRP